MQRNDHPNMYFINEADQCTYTCRQTQKSNHYPALELRQTGRNITQRSMCGWADDINFKSCWQILSP